MATDKVSKFLHRRDLPGNRAIPHRSEPSDARGHTKDDTLFRVVVSTFYVAGPRARAPLRSKVPAPASATSTSLGSNITFPWYLNCGAVEIESLRDPAHRYTFDKVGRIKLDTREGLTKSRGMYYVLTSVQLTWPTKHLRRPDIPPVVSSSHRNLINLHFYATVFLG